MHSVSQLVSRILTTSPPKIGFYKSLYKSTYPLPSLPIYLSNIILRSNAPLATQLSRLDWRRLFRVEPRWLRAGAGEGEYGGGPV